MTSPLQAARRGRKLIQYPQRGIDLSEKPEIVRKPIRRQSAEHYLLITLLSFAASVAG
jgi:hypothetical protein